MINSSFGQESGHGRGAIKAEGKTQAERKYDSLIGETHLSELKRSLLVSLNYMAYGEIMTAELDARPLSSIVRGMLADHGDNPVALALVASELAEYIDGAR